MPELTKTANPVNKNQVTLRLIELLYNISESHQWKILKELERRLPEEKKEPAPGTTQKPVIKNISSDNGGRRLGIERREFSYDIHIPERRSFKKRRSEE